ncbi:MAG: peptidylprolyl isomerase [Burkholderiales bacterium]|nr:peptidylprolyl isomerase [Burkholderiales bacterium]
MMRTYCFPLLAALLLLPAHSEPATLDRIVAVVNKTAITQFELDRRTASVLQNLARQNVTPPAPDVLRKQVLDRIVTEHVLADYGSDTGVRVDDSQLDRAIERIAQQNKMTVPQFKAALEKEGGAYDEFREEVRNDMLMQHLRERDVDGKVYVTESEVDQYMSANKDQAQNEREFHLAHILIQVPEGASPDVVTAKQRRINDAMQALAGGKPFADVAAAYSEAGDALQGGDLGWRSSGRLPPLFLDAIAKIHDGQTTGVIRSPAGYHILKLVAERDRNAKEIIKQTHVEHILIKVNELTSESDGKTRIQEIRERIVNGASFEEQAKLFSEDITASKGGDLDWISPGDTVPEFEQAMNGMTPGDVSQPIRSPYGWHLIKVIERRDQDVTRDHERLRVRNELRERKADEQYDDWVRQERNRAYIEIFDDK